MKEKSVRLMIPGPVQPDNDVLAAMGQPVRPHYGDEWCEDYNLTIDYLKRIFATTGDAFIMVGSGSCGIDTCLGSAFSTAEKIIVGINGFFGERINGIAESYGLKTIVVETPWEKPIDPEAIQNALDQNPDAVGVAVVHLETSTAIVNPIKEIGEIAHKNNVSFFVDAVSSLGGLPFKMDDWKIDFCASSSQKCLGAPPGLSPVAVGEKSWEVINRNPNKNHGWYSNLITWRQYSIEWRDWHPFPITMATSNVMALQKSLKSLLEEGVEKRFERYQKLARRLREGLESLGFNLYTLDEYMAPVLTAVFCPEGVEANNVVNYLLRYHNIKIAGGLGQLKNQIIRIGHMSPATTIVDIDDVLNALSDSLVQQR